MQLKQSGIVFTFFVIKAFLLVAPTVNAQDPQFTQFYAAPLYLNPAFAGATPCWRAGVNYRNQWFLSRRPYSTYMAAADGNIWRYNLGVGGYIFYDNPGAGSYSTYEFAPILAYQLRLKKETYLRFGLQPSYHLKYLNMSDLTFGDQYTNIDGLVQGSNDGTRLPGSLNFFDVSSGVLIFSPKYWIGLAGHHLLRNPFMTDTKTNPVPMKLSLHGGIKIQMNDPLESYFLPAFNIKNQGAAMQTDLGAYYQRDKLLLGMWYRGIPYLTGTGLNSDALAFLIGFQYYQMKIGYSYDLPLSRMINSYGTHELSLYFEFCVYSGKKPRPPRNVMQLPCPQL